MHISTTAASNQETLPLRVRYRAEANGQSSTIRFTRAPVGPRRICFKPALVSPALALSLSEDRGRTNQTVFEFYVLPEQRGRAFDLFEAFVAASGARFFEVQTSDSLLAVMLHAYGCDLASEKIVFRDELTTSLPAQGGTLKRVTSQKESMCCFEARAGKSEWVVELDGKTAGTGGLMFHYNHPYCDVYMEIAEAYRRRGLGAYLVQELKRIAYEMGGIPAARCDPGNVASMKTIQKAGFVPFANILAGKIAIV